MNLRRQVTQAAAPVPDRLGDLEREVARLRAELGRLRGKVNRGEGRRRSPR